MAVIYYYNHFETENYSTPETFLENHVLILRVVSDLLFIQFHLYEEDNVFEIGNLLQNKKPFRLKSNGEENFSVLVESKYFILRLFINNLLKFNFFFSIFYLSRKCTSRRLFKRKIKR